MKKEDIGFTLGIIGWIIVVALGGAIDYHFGISPNGILGSLVGAVLAWWIFCLVVNYFIQY